MRHTNKKMWLRRYRKQGNSSLFHWDSMQLQPRLLSRLKHKCNQSCIKIRTLNFTAIPTIICRKEWSSLKLGLPKCFVIIDCLFIYVQDISRHRDTGNGARSELDYNLLWQSELLQHNGVRDRTTIVTWQIASRSAYAKCHQFNGTVMVLHSTKYNQIMPIGR